MQPCRKVKIVEYGDVFTRNELEGKKSAASKLAEGRQKGLAVFFSGMERRVLIDQTNVEHIFEARAK